MAGWDAVPLVELVTIRADAVGPTGMKGRSSTIELHQKEAAWDVLSGRDPVYLGRHETGVDDALR